MTLIEVTDTKFKIRMYQNGHIIDVEVEDNIENHLLFSVLSEQYRAMMGTLMLAGATEEVVA